MSIDKRKKERLFRRYVKLEKVSKRRSVDCDIFLSIKDALKNQQLDQMSDIISKHASTEVARADILWMIDEAIKIFPEDPVHISQLKSLIVIAEEEAAACESEETAHATIKIKRSHDSPIPPSLEEGELAYSFNSKTLFIGDADGSPRTIIKNADDIVEEDSVQKDTGAKASDA